MKRDILRFTLHRNFGWATHWTLATYVSLSWWTPYSTLHCVEDAVLTGVIVYATWSFLDWFKASWNADKETN